LPGEASSQEKKIEQKRGEYYFGGGEKEPRSQSLREKGIRSNLKKKALVKKKVLKRDNNGVKRGEKKRGLDPN